MIVSYMETGKLRGPEFPKESMKGCEGQAHQSPAKSPYLWSHFPGENPSPLFCFFIFSLPFLFLSSSSSSCSSSFFPFLFPPFPVLFLFLSFLFSVPFPLPVLLRSYLCFFHVLSTSSLSLFFPPFVSSSLPPPQMGG